MFQVRRPAGRTSSPGLDAAIQNEDPGQESDRRHDIDQPVQAAARWFSQDPVPVLEHKIFLDLFFSPPLGQFFADQFAPLGTGLGAAYIQGNIFAHRAVKLLGDGVDLIIRDGGWIDYPGRRRSMTRARANNRVRVMDKIKDRFIIVALGFSGLDNSSLSRDHTEWRSSQSAAAVTLSLTWARLVSRSFLWPGSNQGAQDEDPRTDPHPVDQWVMVDLKGGILGADLLPVHHQDVKIIFHSAAYTRGWSSAGWNRSRNPGGGTVW